MPAPQGRGSRIWKLIFIRSSAEFFCFDTIRDGKCRGTQAHAVTDRLPAGTGVGGPFPPFFFFFCTPLLAFFFLPRCFPLFLPPPAPPPLPFLPPPGHG